MTAALKFPKPVPRVNRKPSGLKRSYIQRKTWMKRRRPRRLDTAQSNPARLDWVHYEVCIGVGRIPGHVCRGRIEACHEGRKPGLAMKCPDDETVPMDTQLHRDWTNHRGFFAGWTKAQRREWMDERIAEVQSNWLGHGGRRGTR